MPIRKLRSSDLSTLCAVVWLCLATTALLSCSDTREPVGRYSQEQDSAPQRRIDVAAVKDAIPREEPRSRYGNPVSYTVLGKSYRTLTDSAGYRERGIASWYGTKFHGHRTSSGESYDMYQMSAAHKTLPLPTYARVTNLKNGKSVIVKINDRGPFHENRLIDLSYAAAARLDILGQGTGLVEVATIDPQGHQPGTGKPRIQASKPKLTNAAPAPVTHPPSLYLQLGAFSSRNNAERLQASLSGDMPGQLHISKSFAGDSPVYRVRIGPLDTTGAADELSKRLTTQGIQSPQIVID